MKGTFVTTISVGLAHGVQAALYDQVIETKYGPVQGIPAFSSQPITNISNWADITVWKGIPFAADTSGANRWRPPQKHAAWNNTLQTNAFGDVCPQGTSFGGPTKRQTTSDTTTTTSENCLNLNIWTSANSTDEKRPVMLWSYPAGGSAAASMFDGGGMAAKGIVFVNYNRRDGPMGWLAHPQLNEEMSREVGRNVSGNWGMLDEFAALQWVYDNIASFGGDPERITVAGQSAGSAATYHMVNSPLTAGLIKGAIVESGIRYPRDPLCSSLAENYRNMSTALAAGVSFMESFNATSVDQLRQLPLDTLNSASGSWGAVLDYWAIPDTYWNTMHNGPANDVPLITGNTKDESGAELPINITVAEYVADLQEQYGDDELAQRFLALYPAANATQAGMSFNAHYRDTSLVSSWLYANGWDASPTTKSPIWTYYWDHAPPGQDRGAFHMSEIPYALDNLYGTDFPWEDEDFEIARKMSAYWVNFVKTQDPNGHGGAGEDGLVRWEANSRGKNVTMRLGDGWGEWPLASPAQIELLEEFFATQHAY
ncbi:Carboxylesterase [Lasiodiplodia theobromae]|uniref:Carboxylesterase n=1 Tax=Lasiodiplodia theobromae TaxID=45133 RepID=UPI0015C30645|nr:Carboxylesterase [Lasiodiplodia theobromae]KAF4540118.1 Carboxylesterase [Lasiodiplodia theobromae]